MLNMEDLKFTKRNELLFEKLPGIIRDQLIKQIIKLLKDDITEGTFSIEDYYPIMEANFPEFFRPTEIDWSIKFEVKGVEKDTSELIPDIVGKLSEEEQCKILSSIIDAMESPIKICDCSKKEGGDEESGKE